MENGNDEQGLCACKSACRQIEVPTEDELVALNAMRSIKEKAKALKEKMDQVESKEAADGGSERARIRQEMDRLRKEWQEWEKRKDRAASQRMILLGHEEPR
jgi:hypothetical protein